VPEIDNPRVDRFAVNIATGDAPKVAAGSVGLAESSAYSLLRREDVKERIREIKEVAIQMAIEKYIVNKEWVIAELVDNVMIAKSAVPVRDKKGNETGFYTIDLSGANRSLELIGKELGMFVDRKEVTMPSLGEYLATLQEKTIQGEATSEAAPDPVSVQ
jgi:phage terminase small subunit